MMHYRDFRFTNARPARMATSFLLAIWVIIAASLIADSAHAQAMTPQQAAATAQAQHGGKVLKVTPVVEGKAYQVKLLLNSGQVVTVQVGG